MSGTNVVGWAHSLRQRYPRTEWAAAALIALVALAVCGVWGLASRSTTMSVATPTALLARDGVYLLESFPQQTGVFQWVAGRSWFQIPNPGGQLLLRMSLVGGPAGATPIQLQAEQSRMAFTVDPGRRSYQLLLPASRNMGVRLSIDTPTVQVAGRDLGIAVSTIAIAGGQSFPLPTVLAFLVASLAIYGLFCSRSLLALPSILVSQFLALWWYSTTGWQIPQAGLALAVIAATALTAMLVGKWWPADRPQATMSRGVLLALLLRLGLLMIGLSLGLILLFDLRVIPAILPVGLVVAMVGSYLFLRQAGLPAALATGLLLLLQLILLAAQAVVGWQMPIVGALAGIVGLLCLIAVVLERSLPLAPAIPLPNRPWAASDTWLLIAVIGVGLAIRLLWLFAPDPVGDIELAARRMGLLQAGGLAAAYTYEGDYMPLWLYTVYGLSTLVEPLGGQFFDPLPAITLAIVKLPSILADLTTAGLIYWFGRRWNSQQTTTLIALLYTVSPPVWINSAWWGQADTLLMLPMVASLLLLDRAGGRWSWLCWAIAQATKPQAIVILPVLAVLTLRRYGCRGLLQAGVIITAVLALAAAPLLVAGQGQELYVAAFTSVGRFPSVTSGAYNVGYLLTGRASIDDTNLLFGPISYRLFGLMLLSATTLVICLALLRRSDMLARFLAAGTLALAFALLPTQIHERYLFLPLAALVLCICLDRWYTPLYLALMVSATLNIIGDLSGFWPAAAFAIRATPLPYALAVANIVMLLVLLWRISSRLPPPPRLSG